ncbi:MAG: ribose-5-phosphate isomerase RpiA [Alphaproteobacteria bacterium]
MNAAPNPKRAAAERALTLVESGMKLGLGTGSTAAEFVTALGARVRAGLEVTGVPTSEDTAALAREAGIPLGELDDLAPLDLTVDGADEIDSALQLIKGGGGALLREKLVAQASRRMAVIADESKLVDRLGRFPLPVEIVPYGCGTTLRRIERLLNDCGYTGKPVRLRRNGERPFRTDGGHFIADCALERIGDAGALARALKALPGVVDHGLFLDEASCAIVAAGQGTRMIERPDRESARAPGPLLSKDTE